MTELRYSTRVDELIHHTFDRNVKRFPASYVQEQFLKCAEDGYSTNWLLTALRFRGRLDRRALGTALYQLVDRHPALRTTLDFARRTAGQVISTGRDMAPHEIDLRDGRGSTEERLHGLVWGEMQRLCDIAAGADLSHASLYTLDDDDHVLALLHHHAISDGWSISILSREVRELYLANAFRRSARLSPLTVEPGEYAARERMIRDPRSETYWQERLKTRDERISVAMSPPADRMGGVVLDTRAIAPVPATEVERLSDLARACKATLAMALLAVIAAALRSQTDRWVTIGFSITNRARRDLYQVVGCLVDCLPVTVDVSGDPTFRDLLERVREAALEAYSHQLPFGRLHDLYGDSSHWSDGSLTDIAVNFWPFDLLSGQFGENGQYHDVIITPFNVETPASIELADRRLVSQNVVGIRLGTDAQGALEGVLMTMRGVTVSDALHALPQTFSPLVSQCTKEPRRCLGRLLPPG